MKLIWWGIVSLVVLGLGLLQVGGAAYGMGFSDTDDIHDALKKVPQGLEVSRYFKLGKSQNNNTAVINERNVPAEDAKVVRLTNGMQQVGSIWSDDNYCLNLNKTQVASMWLYFGNKTKKGTVGDGMALVLQNAGSDKLTPKFDKDAQGNTNIIGETLGVWGVATSGNNLDKNKGSFYADKVAKSAIQNSWALEFDTVLNRDDQVSQLNSGSSFDVTNALKTSINGQHIAANYPAQSQTYEPVFLSDGGSFFGWGESHGFYMRMAHKGLIQDNSENPFLSDGNWHHLTMTYTPKDSGRKAEIKYTFNDKNPDTGSSQPGQANEMTVDTAIIDPDHTGKAYWGFTGATGNSSESNLVVFEQMPNLVNASAGEPTLTANGKNVTENGEIKAHSQVNLTYQLSYNGGTTDWTAIKAQLEIPKEITITHGTLTYDGKATDLTADDLSAINHREAFDLKNMGETHNQKMTLQLDGIAGDRDAKVATTSSRFVGKEAVVEATLPSFEIVSHPLKIMVDKPKILIDKPQDVVITGAVSDPDQLLSIQNVGIQGTVGGTMRVDTTTDTNGHFELIIPKRYLTSGDNNVELRNEAGVGTTVTISLPDAEQPEVPGDVTMQAAGKITFTGQQTGQPQRILGTYNNDFFVQVTDRRAKGSRWSVTVSAEPIKNFHASYDFILENKAVELPTDNDGQSVLVATNESDGTGKPTIIVGQGGLGVDVGLRTNGQTLATGDEYTSKMIWTLQDSPSG